MALCLSVIAHIERRLRTGTGHDPVPVALCSGPASIVGAHCPLEPRALVLLLQFVQFMGNEYLLVCHFFHHQELLFFGGIDCLNDVESYLQVRETCDIAANAT